MFPRRCELIIPDLFRCTGAEAVYTEGDKQLAVDVIMSGPRNDPPIISIELMQRYKTRARCAFTRLGIARRLIAQHSSFVLHVLFGAAFVSTFWCAQKHTRKSDTRPTSDKNDSLHFSGANYGWFLITFNLLYRFPPAALPHRVLSTSRACGFSHIEFLLHPYLSPILCLNSPVHVVGISFWYYPNTIKIAKPLFIYGNINSGARILLIKIPALRKFNRQAQELRRSEIYRINILSMDALYNSSIIFEYIITMIWYVTKVISLRKEYFVHSFTNGNSDIF